LIATSQQMRLNSVFNFSLRMRLVAEAIETRSIQRHFHLVCFDFEATLGTH
jgi:hypothetical protein